MSSSQNLLLVRFQCYCTSPKILFSVSFQATRRLAWRNTIGNWYIIIYYSIGHLDIFPKSWTSNHLIRSTKCYSSQFLQISSLVLLYLVPTNISTVFQSCHFSTYKSISRSLFSNPDKQNLLRLWGLINQR